MLANIFVAAVALLHLYFMILEMFLWDKAAGIKAFGLTPEFARESKTLAANQGLYNGFLVAGLVWGLLMVAGVFGCLTVGKKILYIQAMPAGIALSLVLLR